MARSVATEMAKALGQTIVIENKGGGGGNLAMQDVARADPDGYTLLISHVGSLAMNPFMYANLPYDVNRDFVADLAARQGAEHLRGARDVPAKDLREFVALAKKEPGKLNYGSAGNGSAGHLAMEYLKLVVRHRAAARALQGHRPEPGRSRRRPHARHLGRHAAAACRTSRPASCA